MESASRRDKQRALARATVRAQCPSSRTKAASLPPFLCEPIQNWITLYYIITGSKVNSFGKGVKWGYAGRFFGRARDCVPDQHLCARTRNSAAGARLLRQLLGLAGVRAALGTKI